MMVIDTPEKSAALVRAFEKADQRGPYVPTCDIMKVLEEGEKEADRFVRELRLKKERNETP